MVVSQIDQRHISYSAVVHIVAGMKFVTLLKKPPAEFLQLISLRDANLFFHWILYLENSWAKLYSLENIRISLSPSRKFTSRTFIHKIWTLHTYPPVRYTVVLKPTIQMFEYL